MSQQTPQESEQTTIKEQDIDQESVLSNIDLNTDLNHNLNLSEYCISSDAGTEKMDSDEEKSLASLAELRYAPKLSSLVKQEGPAEDLKRPHEDEREVEIDEAKKIKLPKEDEDEKEDEEKEEEGKTEEVEEAIDSKEKSADARDEQGDEGDNEEENNEEENENCLLYTSRCV